MKVKRMARKQIAVLLASAGMAGVIGFTGCQTCGRHTPHGVECDVATAPVVPAQPEQSPAPPPPEEDAPDVGPSAASRAARPLPYEDMPPDLMDDAYPGDDATPSGSTAQRFDSDFPPVPSQPALTSREGVAALRDLGAVIERDDQGRVISVDLTDTNVDDAGLVNLVPLTSLSELSLHGTAVTDAGLERLLTLTSLKLLDMGDTSLTDAGLAVVKRLRGLEYLLIGRTKITDAGAVHLAEMTNLRGLSLVGVPLSGETLDRLRRALPNCQIVVDTPSELNPVPATSQTAPSAPAVAAATGPALVADETPDAEAEEATPLFPEETTVVIETGDASNVSGIQPPEPMASDDSLMQYRLAVALARKGEIDRALPFFIDAVGEAEAHYTLGVILYQNALESGREQFSRALAMQPEHDDARFWLNELDRQQSRVPRLDNPFQIVRSYDLLPLPMVSPGRTPALTPPPAGRHDLHHATMTTGGTRR